MARLCNDLGVIDKRINGSQMTITWHVDDSKMLHQDLLGNEKASSMVIRNVCGHKNDVQKIHLFGWSQTFRYTFHICYTDHQEFLGMNETQNSITSCQSSLCGEELKGNKKITRGTANSISPHNCTTVIYQHLLKKRYSSSCEFPNYWCSESRKGQLGKTKEGTKMFEWKKTPKTGFNNQ